MLSLLKVKEIIESPVDPLIKWAREMNKMLLLHVDGVGLQDYLARINNYENAEQYEAREKHAITNKFITEELLRPTDNAFNARGGSKNYKFKTDSEAKEVNMSDILSNIRNSQSLSWYVENEWFNKFITDPNGLIVIESEDELVDANNRGAYPTYKSIQSIRGYKQNGVFIDWVVFEAHEVEEEKSIGLKQNTIKRYWALDEVNWYLIRYRNKKIIVERVIEHGFDRPPAVLCSDIVDNVTGWKKSPIDAQVELLNKFVVSNSVLGISEFQHNYPREFMIVDACSHCGGTGNIGKGDEWVDCNNPKCNGGKLQNKDATDVILVRAPEGDQKAIDSIGGYVTLPVDALKLQYTAMDRTWNRIFFSHWGTVVSREGKNETATGRFIDAQPVNNRLNKYSKSIEQLHSILANFIGEYYYPLTFDKAFIQYGRRYLIETPDQIWDKYIKAKTEKAPVSTLDILLSQYLESEFRENETMFIVETKKAKLEPFVHWDIKTVRESETISDENKHQKEFFGEWVQTMSIENLYTKEIEILRGEFHEYVKSKVINKEKNGEKVKQEVVS